MCQCNIVVCANIGEIEFLQNLKWHTISYNSMMMMIHTTKHLFNKENKMLYEHIDFPMQSRMEEYSTLFE